MQTLSSLRNIWPSTLRADRSQVQVLGPRGQISGPALVPQLALKLVGSLSGGFAILDFAFLTRFTVGCLLRLGFWLELGLRLGLWLWRSLGVGLRLRPVFAFQIERYCRANEFLQGGLIDLVAFVNVDSAPDIPREARVE